MSKFKKKKLGTGKYLYHNYVCTNIGYYEPEHQEVWDAVDLLTGCADFHAFTLKDLIQEIDDDIDNEVND